LRNYYEILGIPEESGQREIKAAFKRLAMRYHPDKHAGDRDMEERFKEVNMAYQVLSDPVKKANYDYRLKYSIPTYEAPPPPVYTPPRPPFTRTQFKREFTQEDLRKNARATLWAFGLSLALATVIMGAMKGYEVFEQIKVEALIGERRLVFDEAKRKAESGQISESLEILSTFIHFYKTEEYIREYRDGLMKKVLHEGDVYFQEGNYAEALESYMTVEPFLGYHTFDFNHRLARCYQETGSYKEALDMYSLIVESGLQKRQILFSMGEIYRDNLKDYEESLHYFQLAGNEAIDNYINTFGEAYIILIHSGNVAPEDLDIFLAEARAYLLAGNTEQALHETKWLADVWPKRPEIYLLRAECYRAVGSEDTACQYIDLAARLAPLPANVKACK